MLDRDNTVNLMEDLLSSKHLSAYFEKYDFTDMACLSFTQYLENLLKEKQLRKSILIRRVNLPRSYAYEIFRGHKRPSRDMILILSYGLDLDYKGTQRFLLSAKHNPLHPKDKRDSIMIYAKSNHHTLIETNMLLDEFGQSILQ